MNEAPVVRQFETILDIDKAIQCCNSGIEFGTEKIKLLYKEKLREIQDGMKPKSEKIKLPVMPETEYMKMLRALEPDRHAFVHEKKDIGFTAWTFEELCRYLGFSEAQKEVKTLKNSQFLEDAYSVPVKTYCELFRDAYRIEIKNGDNFYYVVVGAIKGSEVFGLILNKGDKINQLEHYRDLEARLSIEGGFEELKRHYTHTEIENLNKSNSKQLISHMAILGRPVVRR